MASNKKTIKESKKKQNKVTISMSVKVKEMLESLMDILGYDNTSAFISELIRDEYERRIGPIVTPPLNLKEQPSS